MARPSFAQPTLGCGCLVVVLLVGSCSLCYSRAPSSSIIGVGLSGSRVDVKSP